MGPHPKKPTEEDRGEVTPNVDPEREPHPQPGSTSTSDPHPSQDPEAADWEGPKRDKLDR